MKAIARSEWALLALLFSVSVGVQLTPDRPWNLAPIGGLGLYTGSRIGRPWAWVVPILALLITHVVGGFYEPVALVFVYLGFAASVPIGKQLIRPRGASRAALAAPICSGLAFYGISNIGSWLAWYPQDGRGLITCYLNGLPYLGTSILGDAVFGGLFLVMSYVACPVRAKFEPTSS